MWHDISPEGGCNARREKVIGKGIKSALVNYHSLHYHS
jgi:hypothetical protein